MYLSNIKLWNFRRFGSTSDFNLSLPDLDLDFQKSLNVLIGENDSGKSAIIDAIKLVLNTHSYEWLRITEEDFFQEAERFRIEIQFNDLADDEAKNFTEWLGWDGEGENAKPFLRLIYDVTRKKGKIFPSDVHAGVDDEGYRLTAEAREYLKVTFLKPLRDAKAEFIPKKNSRLSQILQGHEAFQGSEESHHLVKLFTSFNQSIEKYFEAKKPIDNASDCFEDIDDKKGKELKDKIDELIHDLYDKTKDSKFTVSEGKLKNMLEKLELSIKDEINPGLGTLNRLFIASELLHLDKNNWNGVRLGLIEELEAHLHPQAQMQIIESLQNKNDVQLILTTHSPNLASKVKLSNLIICNDNHAYPMGEEHTQLDDSDYSFLERFLDTTKSNLFFAKGVILVEGWAEEIILPALAKKAGYNLTEKGVSVINVASTAFLRYAKIFQRNNDQEMNIPVAIITDLDVKFEDEEDIIEGISKKDFETDKKTSKYNGQVVKTFVSPHRTLEYCLSKSSSLGLQFKEIVKGIHSGTDWSDFE
ncbi:MAG: AAA family ATPase, partial [Desulfobacterales bacterium]|nr:AAA family ATPase [Desulfobacterales bacterium]